MVHTHKKSFSDIKITILSIYFLSIFASRSIIAEMDLSLFSSTPSISEMNTQKSVLLNMKIIE